MAGGSIGLYDRTPQLLTPKQQPAMPEVTFRIGSGPSKAEFT